MTGHRSADLPPGGPQVATPEPLPVPPQQAALVPLPSGHRACHGCGVAVPYLGGDVITAEVTMQDGRTLTDLQTGISTVLERVALLTCDGCQERDQQAEDLVVEHTDLARRLGQGRAVMRVRATLDALAVIGQPLPDLSSPGAALSIVQAVSRAEVEGVSLLALLTGNAPKEVQVCSPAPWSHVSDSDRRALRAAFGAHLAERAALNAPPVAVPPPMPPSDRGSAGIPGGCLFCGLGALVLPAAEVVTRGGIAKVAEEEWTHRRVSAVALGTGGPTLSGYLCPPCDRATTEVGSIGGTAMDRALRAHLLAAGRDDDARWIVEGETYGIRGWAALVCRARLASRPEPRANAEPWAHVVVTAEVRALPVPEWEDEEVVEQPAEPAPRVKQPPRKRPKRKRSQVKRTQPTPPPPPTPTGGYMPLTRF